jgi:hypothetical protein
MSKKARVTLAYTVCLFLSFDNHALTYLHTHAHAHTRCVWMHQEPKERRSPSAKPLADFRMPEWDQALADAGHYK